MTSLCILLDANFSPVEACEKPTTELMQPVAFDLSADKTQKTKHVELADIVLAWDLSDYTEGFSNVCTLVNNANILLNDHTVTEVRRVDTAGVTMLTCRLQNETLVTVAFSTEKTGPKPNVKCTDDIGLLVEVWITEKGELQAGFLNNNALAWEGKAERFPGNYKLVTLVPTVPPDSDWCAIA